MATKRSRWPRRVVMGLAITALVVEGMWLAIHRVPGFGPAVADGARAVLGPSAVAWAEDTAYGISDRINCWRYEGAAPRTFWEPDEAAAPHLPAAAPKPDAPEAVHSSPAGTFPPENYSPPFPQVAAPGDGVWIAIAHGSREGEAPFMFKSVVHPDPKRSFAAVAIVAMHMQRLDLHMMAGTDEPASTAVAAADRPGVIPKEHQADLVSVFNGGFKATHGHYGMMIDGRTFLSPRDIACTIGLYKDGTIRIGSWPSIEATEPTMRAYRQTPPCLVEGGEINAALAVETNRSWGATVSGETVIRRSAIGIDASGQTLLYGLGEAVTAQALGRAMQAAGARGAAQLDVNYAYPRFLFYGPRVGADGPRALSAIIPHIEYERWDYVLGSSPRDFFYVTRRRPAS